MEENKVRKVLAKILNDADTDSYYTETWHDCVALRILQSPDLRVTLVEPPKPRYSVQNYRKYENGTSAQSNRHP